MRPRQRCEARRVADPGGAALASLPYRTLGMTIADYHVRVIARNHSERHGANAIEKARERVRDLVRQGDPVGADMWIRIVIVLKEVAGARDAAGEAAPLAPSK